MAAATITRCNSLLLLLIIFTSILQVKGSTTQTQQLLPNDEERVFSHSSPLYFQGDGKKMKRNSRRLMIGSTAPTCTYNECRGCKYKCSAEQVPVEGNDPINSAYHYKCVCHRKEWKIRNLFRG
ncbi:uncharacterized protein LOC110821750 isoform X2 [Carica papaya]|uniref:uncharacterized protein LOC110821750 isoform X2 n=1 Tax=Carica papaya TaxID=3649 RepID=UPI000B8CBCD4|nr:uncharacterized protein LOC110821750 isoform X2 [Carica papaya]